MSQAENRDSPPRQSATSTAVGQPPLLSKAIANATRGREQIDTLEAIVSAFCAAVGEPIPQDAICAARRHREALERLRDVAGLLGLLSSSRDTDGRVIFLAYLIATDSKEEHIAEARAEVEALKPGWLKRAASLRDKVAAGV